MKKATKKHLDAYNESYWKMVEKVKTSEKCREEELRKGIFEDLERILDGKKMILEGNFIKL
jgi:hypothetical protein